MSKLLDYINLLDKDATARAAHAQDPVAAMTQFGLNSSEQQAMQSGDKTAVANSIGIDVNALPTIQTPNFDSTY